MSTRITEKQLQYVVDRINAISGTASEPYTDGKTNALNYHISGAYGGISLHQMGANGSGTRDVFGCGHVPKHYLYDLMHAYLSGLTAIKRRSKTMTYLLLGALLGLVTGLGLAVIYVYCHNNP